MMTISAVKNAGQAASYFEQKDDYYTKDSDGAYSKWQGTGSKALNLKEGVDAKDFNQVLSGILPSGEQLGRIGTDGSIEHKPGWDLTFSAPKSVSIAALVGDDNRLIEAHDKAVSAALERVEKEFLVTRVKNSGKLEYQTGSMIAATFRHEDSRAQDPQLHTHSIIANMLQREDGQWRSIESHSLYKAQKELGLFYKQELAKSVRRLGYSIDQTGKNGEFELKEIPKELCHQFSKRSRDIEKALDEIGLDRDKASAAKKETLTLKTREKKQAVDHNKQREKWSIEASKTGVNISEIVNKIKSKSLSNTEINSIDFNESLEANYAVNKAIVSLTERNSIFSRETLIRTASEFGNSSTDINKISQVIDQLVKDHNLLRRNISEYDPMTRTHITKEAFTTLDIQKTEQRIIDNIKFGRNSLAAPISNLSADMAVFTAESNSISMGYGSWSEGQKRATKGILTNTDFVTVVQGFAGTAKTSTVLKTVGKEFENKGFKVVGMAPSASAAQSLNDSGDIDSKTVHKHLIDLQNEKRDKLKIKADGDKNVVEDRQQQVWIVDEASLLGTKLMDKLLSEAKANNARVILVGDINQHGSVEQGAAFRQIQENGSKTYVLDNIVRQENIETRKAVYASIQGDAKAALDHLNNGGGKVIDSKAKASDRLEQMAKDYAMLSKQDRSKTIVIEPSRKGRDTLNENIRKELREAGELSGERLHSNVLSSKGLTKAEARDFLQYENGDIVRFGRDLKRQGIAQGDYLKVVDRDGSFGTVYLENSEGQKVSFNPQRQGKNVELYRESSRDFQNGDKVVFNKNDKELGLKNGDKGVVILTDKKSGTVTVELLSGKKLVANLNEDRFRHIDHAYVQTSYASQGQTAQRAMIHADSQQLNLVDQKSLYVGISRSTHGSYIYTDNKNKLIEHIKANRGEKSNAMDKDKLVDSIRSSNEAMRATNQRARPSPSISK